MYDTQENVALHTSTSKKDCLFLLVSSFHTSAPHDYPTTTNNNKLTWKKGKQAVLLPRHDYPYVYSGKGYRKKYNNILHYHYNGMLYIPFLPIPHKVSMEMHTFSSMLQKNKIFSLLFNGPYFGTALERLMRIPVGIILLLHDEWLLSRIVVKIDDPWKTLVLK